MAARNPKALRGYSRDHRLDAKQVCVGLVVEREGFPVGMEVWPGNIKDHQAFMATLDKLEARFGRPDEQGKPRPKVCMDRGLATQENVAELRRRGYRYVVATRRSEARRYWERMNPDGWQVLRRNREGVPWVEIQEVGRDGLDRLILVRSAGAREKERGIHNRFLGRLKADLEKLARVVAQGKLKDPAKIHQRIGRLQERYAGVSSWVHVELLQAPAGQRLSWLVRPDAEALARTFEGIYLLRTNVEGDSPEQIWQDYIQLIRIEATFRSLKHDLDWRPIFHQKGDRVEAHLFFSFLAYVLLWALEHQHRTRGGRLSGRRILETLHRLKLVTIGMTTTQGQPLRLERVQVPDRQQAELLSTLHMALPKPRVRLSPLQLLRGDTREPLSLVTNFDSNSAT